MDDLYPMYYSGIAGCFNKRCDQCAHNGSDTCLPEYTKWGVDLRTFDLYQLAEKVRILARDYGDGLKDMPDELLVNELEQIACIVGVDLGKE